jgi:hypothetical protein
MDETLRLADALEALLGYRGINPNVGQAAAELRRLHFEINRLRALVGRALEAWSQPNGINYVDFRPYMDALRAALAEQEQEQEQEQEPVAWRYKAMVGMRWSMSDDGYYISCKRDQGYIVEPLYTHPPRRDWVGLTDEEMDRWTPEIHPVIHAIEQTLKERNT